MLTTPRLVLAPHLPADLPDSAAMWAEASTNEHIGGRPLTREEVWGRLLRHVGHWSVLGYGYWTVRERGTGAFVGEVGLLDGRRDSEPSFEGVPEAGWALAPAARGRGYALEAVGAALAWADGRGMTRTVCIIDPPNTRSIRLAEAAGFREVGPVLYRDATTLLFERLAGALDISSSPAP